MYRYTKDDMFLFSPKTMPITKIMIFFATLLTISMTTNIFSVILEAGFKVFNLSAKPTLAVSKTTFAEYLYICVIGPIIEELIYRGTLMTQLKKYGIHFAILFSAFYFGLIHHDLYQGISAGLGGIIFGYVAYRYSLLYSIVLHITSNTFATITSTIKSNDTLSNLLVITIILIALITTLVVGIKYLKNRSSSHLLPQKTSSEHMIAMEKLLATSLCILDLVILIHSSFHLLS
ncbi:CAAX amino terminal protease family protein [Streptococcus gallolyticus subsp. gallolyticus ATCC BAA-2069]|nr:CAAX amino terminal protease family protein [Streptococcus gallolyticus subsp. gallolyticus ATCC BAA-2069]